MKKVFFILIVASTIFSCDINNALDEISKSPLEKSIESVAQTWTVDSVRYTRYSIDKSVISDQIMPVGVMTFSPLKGSELSPSLRTNQGFIIHKYQLNGTNKTDTTAWDYGVNSDVKLAYLNIYYKNPLDKTYSGGKTIYDVIELSSTKLYIERYEALGAVGQTTGYLRSIMKMHR